MEESKTYEAFLESISYSDENAIGIRYRYVIGSLIYLTIIRCSDIASYSVGKLAQFFDDPKEKHWIAETGSEV